LFSGGELAGQASDGSHEDFGQIKTKFKLTSVRFNFNESLESIDKTGLRRFS
jgi:hypothetical protein